MEIIKEAMEFPTNNLLGILIYLVLLTICTILITSAFLYLIPNPLSRRIKNAITAIITIIVIVIWFYYAVIQQF